MKQVLKALSAKNFHIVQTTNGKMLRLNRQHLLLIPNLVGTDTQIAYYSDIEDDTIHLPPEQINVEIDRGNNIEEDNVLIDDNIGNLNVDEQLNDGEGEVRQSRYGRALRPPTHLADYDTV